jgi:hypothetical protein
MNPKADPLDELLAASRARGERVALATVRDGAYAGARLAVWPAGHAFGDLGWPRLNQRVALYAEQLLERPSLPAPHEKRFDVPGAGRVLVAIEVLET